VTSDKQKPEEQGLGARDWGLGKNRKRRVASGRRKVKHGET